MRCCRKGGHTGRPGAHGAARRRAAARGRTRFRAIFPGDDADEARRRFARGQVQGDDFVTPDGTIIRIGGPEMKPETDPGWEERQAQRKAKRAREETPSSSSDSPAESPLGKALSSPVVCGSPCPWRLVWDDERSTMPTACKQGQNDLAPYLQRTPGLLCTHKTLRKMLIRVREARREAAPPPHGNTRAHAAERATRSVRMPLFMNSIQTHEFECN